MKRKRIFISTISVIILLSFITLFILIKNRSLANEISFTSKNYHIEDNLITNISPNTDIELFYKYFDTTNCSITVTNENNEPLTNGFIYTGSKTNVYDSTNNLVNSYINIITGDINYDGLVDIKDIETLATYLIEENNLDDHQKKAIDINKDNEIKINDLTLLEEYLNSDYESITFSNDEIVLMSNEQERLIPIIKPNMILNQNLNWSSSNEDAITVDESGKITAHNEGESIITATTKDGFKTTTIRIIVDNKPRLSKDEINIYSGPKETTVGIKAIDYQDLSCTSNDTNIATCSIENNQLIVTSKKWASGQATITVTSPTYGSTELTVNVTFVNFSVFPKFSCIRANASASLGAISPLNAGSASINEIYEVIGTDPTDENYRTPNREIVNNVIVYPNSFNIITGSKTGKAEIDFIESNGNNISTITVYTYRLSLSNYSGTTSIGTNLSTNINAENIDTLSCKSLENEIATCLVQDNKLIVTPVSVGTATITVTGATGGTNCESIVYTATITDSTPEPSQGGAS